MAARLQDRWAVQHAELASAKDSHSKLREESQDITVDAQAAAKRFLPFSTGKGLHIPSPLSQQKRDVAVHIMPSCTAG